MSKPDSSDLKYVSTNLIPASESKSLIWWIVYICFAYHYKVIACGFFGKILGYNWFCHTMVHGVTLNHWFEQLIYAPILWYALYRIIVIIFGPEKREVLSPKIRRQKTIAFFLLAMYIYGIGIHFTNTIEIYSRTQLGITSGLLYDQVYWVDEQLSHWIQFFFFFTLFSWIIIYDRLDRVHAGYIAVFTGLLHGLERAIGVIEGDSPYIAIVLGGVILIACFIRWQRHGRDFPRVWQDFFFRHGLSFGLSMPIALYFYQFAFDGFVQPSSMGDRAWLVILFVAVVTAIGFCLAVFLDKLLIKKVKK
ncbi:MAG: hypothetical protein ACI8P3_002753 [Saprospiraceae bacterium]|jgi:hypothetical protein